MSGGPRSGKYLPLYCDEKGSVYELPGGEPAFRTGRRFVRVDPRELIALPCGSVLFSLPGRLPVIRDRTSGGFRPVERPAEGVVWAASSFFSSGYLRTYLPAFVSERGAPVLPLWAYAGVVIRGDGFYAPGFRVDPDPRSDPEIHDNDPKLKKAIKKIMALYADNRLIGQLARCSVEFRCLCARNFFLGRYEAPIPTSPSCNARCLGCLSLQESSGFEGSHDRIPFSPTPAEIAQAILFHFGRVDAAVASFGQGCEGEPLMRGRALARAVRMVRESTSAGTINLNTNGSLPAMVAEMAEAGLDSIRISMNSPTEEYYTRHFRPVGYAYADVLRSLETALAKGLFVSINLFILPGFSDMETEVESLFRFLRRFPVHMLQARNLNIDPDFYLDSIDFRESEPIGVRRMIGMLRREFPAMKIGYYNPPKERFGRPAM